MNSFFGCCLEVTFELDEAKFPGKLVGVSWTVISLLFLTLEAKMTGYKFDMTYLFISISMCLSMSV